jgi:hypothetical protein
MGMRKYIFVGLVGLMAVIYFGCGIPTTQITLTYRIDDIASTDQNVDKYWLDLTTEPDYEEHRDNIREIESIAIVAIVINNGDVAASGEVWVDTDSNYTEPDTVTTYATRVFVSPTVDPGDTLRINWGDAYIYMEGDEYLDSLIMDEGAFAVYGLADQTPFDIRIIAEVVITLTVGR